MSIETAKRGTYTIDPDVRETLAKALKLIEAGWCRFSLKREISKKRPPCYCLSGAIAEACGIELDPEAFSPTAYLDMEKNDLCRRCMRSLGFFEIEETFRWNDRQPDAMPVLTKIKIALDGKLPPWAPKAS